MGRALSILLGGALNGAAVVYARGAEAFATVPALAGLALVYVALTVAALFVGGNLSPGAREDRENRWVLPVFAVLGLAIAVTPAFDDAHGISTFGGDGLRWLGVTLFALGGVLRLWPVAVLGHRFSGLVAIQPNHRLQTTGVYSVIRHPSYLGLLVSSLGWALAFRSGIGVVLVGLLLIPLVGRIKAEENLLASQFGADYDAFRARTWRMIPGLW
ncbi:isoprenylcysteine carboxylmethyltransferase family protein [Rhodoblastus acidophilus]|uniref:Isoprenylcysteine carboxylmethyltransferase family protein n=1 Tax=Rhodoblastus acidophilus TaxID=1074 RepID=A0A6N8DI20_RHOAC|nr:isoprenylcysteine carboxylmethyltransferase family protein [Rhodoblastus acidophilus]MCW2273216.1 protein-S-isoprenylcysteine O-methyltransferase Ste14 [Rhodoblastus acidophilus]MTV30112.1 isoprenylcysteine carboxylmethyltransferase family protein [Rhodoblastus acidophilus]